MAIKENVKSTMAYIKINRGKDGKGNDIILKAFKLPVSKDIQEDKILEMLVQVEELTNYPLTECSMDIVTEIVEETTGA